MRFLESVKTIAIYFSFLFPSPLSDTVATQQPILPGRIKAPLDTISYDEQPPYFKAPNGPDSGDPFICSYPDLGPDWTDCSTPDDRSCWLKGPNQQRFDINTDYETSWPTGVTREYHLDVESMPINGDGVINPDGKVFNGQYPGPWIQACWGDLIKVTVKNKLKYNGTTIHWHGLRQLGSVEMDGVNGVTQCPIAPKDEFTYTFRATQYGTTWYHSHYSLQYADGLHGPITIYGPSPAPWDEGRDPIIITDWNHRSAFRDWQRELVPLPSFPSMNSVLINGIGNFAGAFSREKFNMTVEMGKKYLLRIINTSVDTTYIFSVDNHNFTVMSSDFVPVVPYNVSHIVVGIGQRYHVVLNAVPINQNDNLSPTGDYWIRAIAADGCKGFETGNEPDERQGILRYNASSTDVARTFREPFSKACRDEAYDRLEPVLRWNVTPAALPSSALRIGKQDRPDRPAQSDRFSWWAFGDDPLWLDFSDPTIMNLHNTSWDRDYVVIEGNYPADAWVYLVVTAPSTPAPGPRSFFPVAHPMHLHGHDFALLAQGNDSADLTNGNVQLKFDNPPRRDVALLPAGGYLVIAFKADNPGTWLFHCHIAWHASSGLALQIMERQADLQKMMTDERMAEVRRVCARWDDWLAVKANHWNASAPFQDDSGI